MGRIKKIQATLADVSRETLLLTTFEGQSYLVDVEDIKTAVSWEATDRLEIEPDSKQLGMVIIRRLATVHPAMPQVPDEEIRATVI